MEVTKWLKLSVECHELASFDFRCGSKLPVHDRRLLCPESGVMQRKSARYRTSHLKCRVYTTL
jgi:hypothetical protein